MTSAKTETADRPTKQYSADALAYEAPFLIEKLLKERIVDTEEEAKTLFTEVKRFIVLVQTDNALGWEMYSLRVDETWHQFILFTKQYMNFCDQFFGRYIPHSPSNAPKSDIKDWAEALSFDAFQTRYAELFGEPLPDVWYDESSVKTHRRVLNDRAGSLTVQDKDGMVELLTAEGDILLAVNELARDALVFVARTGAFYVRELPGDLTDEEKVALAATLVEHGLLRVGA